MNEFIVWDKTEVGKKPRLVDFDSFSIKENWIYLELRGKEVLHAHIDDVEICWYIHKTDDTPQKNKIYADSSIVELVDSGSRGIFFFDEKYLKFKFAFNGDIATSLGMESFEKTAQFKIIGTLQENQELLGVNK